MQCHGVLLHTLQLKVRNVLVLTSVCQIIDSSSRLQNIRSHEEEETLTTN
jgi:hypothetical protein